MKNLKKPTLAFFLLLSTFFTFAQDKPKSPPETATGTINGASITINYGSPSVRGRKIWGELVPLDKVWRAGANNATTVNTDKDLTIDGKKLPAGKYSFFVIPNAESSTIIFNKVSDQWGAYKYDEKKDQLRFKVKPEVMESSTEKLFYLINGNDIVLNWENWRFIIPVK
jgi:Protein of unknown function (DUF2911)